MHRNQIKGEYTVLSKDVTDTGLFIRIGLDEEFYKSIQKYKVEDPDWPNTYRIQVGITKLNFTLSTSKGEQQHDPKDK